ncbi:MAG: cyclic lactone autoinducer peptide [Bacilli bacterium]
MKRVLTLIADYFFHIAINSANMVSMKGVYQPKEPQSLQKYIK